MFGLTVRLYTLPAMHSPERFRKIVMLLLAAATVNEVMYVWIKWTKFIAANSKAARNNSFKK